jgi:DNA-directed RNA polymerase specialized sigma24 family protein
MATQHSSRPSLTIIEAPAAWAAFAAELDIVIANAIRTMGLADARRGVAPGNIDGVGRAPSTSGVRVALLRDIDLALEIREAIWGYFCAQVIAGRIWRDGVGGWFQRVGTRTARRLATRRARELFRFVESGPNAGSPLDRVADPGPSLDERLDDARLRGLARGIIDELTEEERELLDLAEAPRDYAELAMRRNTTPGALRVRAHRLVARLRARLLEDLGYVQEAAE